MTDLGALTPREREVALAAAEGADVRSIAERLVVSPRTVEHHLSAAYRKLGVGSRPALMALLREHAAAGLPVTRYAVSGDAHIAYQAVGDGDRDVVLIPGFISNVETAWSWPPLASFLRRLAHGRRLIVFDKRGTGLSDPVPDPSRLTLEQRMDEVRAVMDAAGSRRAALFGFSEGAALSMLFAATYPARVNGLVLYGALISGSLDPEASGTAGVFADPAGAWELMKQVWGTGQFLAPFGPSASRHESEMPHVARFERHGASPAAAYAIIRMAGSIEVRGLCPAVQTPSLVLHRRDDALVPVANSRYLAGHLPAARYVELAGRDHPPWLGDTETLLAEAGRFLSADHPVPHLGSAARLLQTLVMAGGPLGPPQLAAVERFRGRPATSRYGLVYAFEGPVRAVQCAIALAGLSPGLRLAVHAGELDLSPGGVTGPMLAITAAVLAAAAPGEVIVTAAVKDLTLGSDLHFRPVPDLPTGTSGDRLALYRAGPGETVPAPLRHPLSPATRSAPLPAQPPPGLAGPSGGGGGWDGRFCTQPASAARFGQRAGVDRHPQHDPEFRVGHQVRCGSGPSASSARPRRCGAGAGPARGCRVPLAGQPPAQLPVGAVAHGGGQAQRGPVRPVQQGNQFAGLRHRGHDPPS